MKAGAVDFLTKPFRDQDMLDAVTTAIERDRVSRDEARILSGLHTRFATLTPREREVIALVTSGLMNKQIAAEIGIAEITVKIHRGHIMRKNGCEVAARSGENGGDARDRARIRRAANLSMILRLRFRTHSLFTRLCSKRHPLVVPRKDRCVQPTGNFSHRR
jgi:DNA-binding NarL/FixJ family response regulator